jgi:hypothetical protein
VKSSEFTPVLEEGGGRRGRGLRVGGRTRRYSRRKKEEGVDLHVE